MVELVLKKRSEKKSEKKNRKHSKMVCPSLLSLALLCLALSGSAFAAVIVMECNMLGLSFDCHHRPTDYIRSQSVGKELSPR